MESKPFFKALALRRSSFCCFQVQRQSLIRALFLLLSALSTLSFKAGGGVLLGRAWLIALTTTSWRRSSVIVLARTVNIIVLLVQTAHAPPDDFFVPGYPNGSADRNRRNVRSEQCSTMRTFRCRSCVCQSMFQGVPCGLSLPAPAKISFGIIAGWLSSTWYCGAMPLFCTRFFVGSLW